MDDNSQSFQAFVNFGAAVGGATVNRAERCSIARTGIGLYNLATTEGIANRSADFSWFGNVSNVGGWLNFVRVDDFNWTVQIFDHTGALTDAVSTWSVCLRRVDPA